MLIQRRDKIAHAYLNAINPVVNVALDGSGALTFDNAAVGAGVAEAPAGGYVVHWSRFDNNTGTATRDRHVDSRPGTAARRRRRHCRSEPGSYIKVEIRAVQPEHPSWGAPLSAFFRRDAGWRLVGLERMP